MDQRFTDGELGALGRDRGNGDCVAVEDHRQPPPGSPRPPRRGRRARDTPTAISPGEGSEGAWRASTAATNRRLRSSAAASRPAPLPTVSAGAAPVIAQASAAVVAVCPCRSPPRRDSRHTVGELAGESATASSAASTSCWRSAGPSSMSIVPGRTLTLRTPPAAVASTEPRRSMIASPLPLPASSHSCRSNQAAAIAWSPAPPPPAHAPTAP